MMNTIVVLLMVAVVYVGVLIIGKDSQFWKSDDE